MIINPEIGEEEASSIVENVNQFVTGHGGVASQTEQWGKRRLAFPIKHFNEGSYILLRFKLEPSLGKELESSLRITESVLRHMLIRTGDR